MAPRFNKSDKETAPVLRTAQDWPKWHDYVRRKLVSANIWKYCDPSTKDEAQKQTMEFNQDEIVRKGVPRENAFEYWKLVNTQARAVEETMAEALFMIWETIEYGVRVSIQSETDIRQILIEAKAVVGYSERTHENLVRSKIIQQGKTVKSKDVEVWLVRWAEIHSEAGTADMV